MSALLQINTIFILLICPCHRLPTDPRNPTTRPESRNPCIPSHFAKPWACSAAVLCSSAGVLQQCWIAWACSAAVPHVSFMVWHRTLLCTGCCHESTDLWLQLRQEKRPTEESGLCEENTGREHSESWSTVMQDRHTGTPNDVKGSNGFSSHT